MAEINDDEVRIIPADQSLLTKFGKGNLDKMLSPERISRAQTVITAASDEFYNDCVDESLRLHGAIRQLRIPGQDFQLTMKKIVEVAFAIKTKAGQAGYDLVAALAKSLHVFCEDYKEGAPSATMLKIIDWHDSSIKQILALKTKGSGGDIGKAIMAEIASFASAS